MAGDDFPPPDLPPSAGSSNPNERTMPHWMDHLGIHGQRIILSLSSVDGKSLPKNPFIISKSIDLAGAKIESARTEEKGAKYVLATRSADHAKKLVEMKELIDGTKVKVVPHPTLNISRCVVSCREVVEMDEKHLEEELAPQGVNNVRRIKRTEGKERVNTPTLILTVYGTVIPKHIMFGPLRIATRVFYPSPMICFNCCNYGHTKLRCENTIICKNCSQSHPTLTEECNNEPFCKNCQGAHPPTSRKCPVFVKEEQINKIKVDCGITFGDARKEYAKRHGEDSYAAVTGAQERLERIRTENAKDEEIRCLKEEVKKLKDLMANTGIVASKDEKDLVIERLRAEVGKMKKLVEQLKANLQKRSEEQEISVSEEDEPMYEQDNAACSTNSLMEITYKQTQRSAKRCQIDDSDPRCSSDDPDRTVIGNKITQPKAKRGRGRPRKQHNV